MFCPECGKVLLESSRICQTCGASLPESVMGNEAMSEINSPETGSEQKEASFYEEKKAVNDKEHIDDIHDELSEAKSEAIETKSLPETENGMKKDAGIENNNQKRSTSELIDETKVKEPTQTCKQKPYDRSSKKEDPSIQEALKNIRLYLTISASVNGLAAIVVFILVFLVGLLTLGCGCVFIVFPIINIVSMILDIMAIIKLNQSHDEQCYNKLKEAAYVEFAAFYTVVQIITGILITQSLQKSEIKEYFGVNGK